MMIYIVYVDLFDKCHCGVIKKVMSQIKVFQKYFEKVYYTTYSGQTLYLMEEGKIIDKETAITRAMCSSILVNWLDKYKIRRSYIRYNLAHKWFLQFLKEQKERKIKSVLEIPTYPYDGELEDGRVKIEDQYYRRQLYQYIGHVATNSEIGNIWGIPCVRLLNGVDVEAHPLCLKNMEKGKITLIAVSTMAIWHGYERILKGLFNYYEKDGEYNLRFKMIGNGPEEEKYRELALRYGLESKVEFLGTLEGEDLDRQYNLSDIAVSSLGLYKTNIQNVTPIKGAEYCARGIPFICGYQDMRFPQKAEYVLTVPNNEEPLDMMKVIDFYENIISRGEYKKTMRDYAMQHFTWDDVMLPIVEILK